MGEKEIDNDELISIKTKFGTIEINRLDILEITEISSQTSASSEGLSDYNEYLQNYFIKTEIYLMKSNFLIFYFF